MANTSGLHDTDSVLAEMANDPEIQRELAQIAHEFAATEMDGLVTHRPADAVCRNPACG